MIVLVMRYAIEDILLCNDTYWNYKDQVHEHINQYEYNIEFRSMISRFIFQHIR